MFAIVLVGIFSVYLLALLSRKKFSFRTSFTKGLKLFGVALLLMLVVIFLLAKSNIYLRGYWIPKIIFWLWFFSIMLLFAFGSKSVGYKWEWLFYKIVYYLPLAFIPLLLVPFLGIGIALRVYESVIGDKSMILYSSQKVRIEQPSIRFLGPDPPITIFVKNKIFSHKVTTIPIQFNGRHDSLHVTEPGSNRLHIVYCNNHGFDTTKTVQEFDISLNE